MKKHVTITMIPSVTIKIKAGKRVRWNFNRAKKRQSASISPLTVSYIFMQSGGKLDIFLI
jgi:hypothetical protein